MEEELMQDEIRGGEKIRRIGLENLRKEWKQIKIFHRKEAINV